MKQVLKEDLIIPKSMELNFGGATIFFSSLDALYQHTDIAVEKFLKDMETIRKPSSPSLIAIHFDETVVTKELANTVIRELKNAGIAVKKVVFVGLKRKGQKLIRAAITSNALVLVCAFNNDYEKAKEWLVNK